MKKYLFIIALLGCTAVVAQNKVIVKKTDGTTEEYKTTDVQKINFVQAADDAQNKMVFSIGDSATVEYMTSDIEKVSFKKMPTGGGSGTGGEGGSGTGGGTSDPDPSTPAPTDYDVTQYFTCPAFLNYMLSEFDFDQDGRIMKSEADQVYTIDIRCTTTTRAAVDEPITSLDGIEKCENLRELILKGNNIAQVDLSQNTNLVNVDCVDNGIEEITLGNNDNLVTLDVSGNNIEEIDVTTAPALTTLNVSDNAITEINVENNASLQTLNVSGNEITEINVENNTALQNLNVSGNDITEIDLSNNTSLQTLDVSDNDLTTLDVSASTNLYNVNLSGNDNLQEVEAPAQVEQQVKDQVAESVVVKTYVTLNDMEFHKFILSQFDTDEDGRLSTEEAAEVREIILEDNWTINRLYCNYLPNLESLTIHNSAVNFVGVNVNTELRVLNISDNWNLSGLWLNNNPELTEIHCSNTDIYSLNVSYLSALQVLDAVSESLYEIYFKDKEQKDNLIELNVLEGVTFYFQGESGAAGGENSTPVEGEL